MQSSGVLEVEFQKEDKTPRGFPAGCRYERAYEQNPDTDAIYEIKKYIWSPNKYENGDEPKCTDSADAGKVCICQMESNGES